MQLITALLAGLVFGVGLIVSGMVNPAKVLGFLDLSGGWDPSLALVMAAALVVSGIAFAVAGKRSTTLLGTPMLLPAGRNLEPRLMLGSLLFGVGWGLAGNAPVRRWLQSAPAKSRRLCSSSQCWQACSSSRGPSAGGQEPRRPQNRALQRSNSACGLRHLDPAC